MSSIILTKPVFEKLIEHLIYIEESSDSLVEFIFPEPGKEREDMKLFFRRYVKAIEDELENVTVIKSHRVGTSPGTLNHFPFVIIGSEVDLEDETGKVSSVYRLIHPDSPSKVKNEITYLSPIGKELLMKNKGSKISIEVQSDIRHLRIKSIRLVM